MQNITSENLTKKKATTKTFFSKSLNLKKKSLTFKTFPQKQFPPNMIYQFNGKQKSSKNFLMQLAVMQPNMQLSKKWMVRTRGESTGHLFI